MAREIGSGASDGSRMGPQILLLSSILGATVFLAPLFGRDAETPFRAVAAALMLAVPALSKRKGGIRLFGPYLVLPLSVYLTTLHAPLERIAFGGEPMDPDEARVVEIACYAAF